MVPTRDANKTMNKVAIDEWLHKMDRIEAYALAVKDNNYAHSNMIAIPRTLKFRVVHFVIKRSKVHGMMLFH